MSQLTISVLGPLAVTLDGTAIRAFKYNKARALLAYLAVEGEKRHLRGELCALLWPDLSEHAGRRNLSQVLSWLRSVLDSGGPARILADPETVGLNPDLPVWLDVGDFTARLTEAERHPHRSWHTCGSCAEHLQTALTLYRGDFLSQLSVPDSSPFEEWALGWRERLRQRALSALERLVQRAQWCGDFQVAAEHARRMIDIDSLQEASHRELIRSLALDGQWAAAEAHYEHLRRTLQSELAVEPEAESVTLHEQVRTQARRELQRFAPPPFQCPAPPNALIGRRREVEEAKRLLRTSRLLTLTGPGGTGKTRLALQVAAEAAVDFAEGVYFVDLAPLAAHTLVANAIAGALGVFEVPTEPLLTTLRRALTGRNLLLVIDNFEHVIAAAPWVSELLSASADVHVIATSRESLRVAGEQEYFVQPLSLPEPGASSRHNLDDSEAVAFFVQRVQMMQPGFVLDDANAAAIGRICTRLDGLPLALELAAARCKLLPPQALAERLAEPGGDSPLGTLAGGGRDAPRRHRTLRDTMAWSYGLLGEDEQRLFAGLAVFRGGRSLEAVEAVCGEGLSLQVLDGLTSLVDKSLVQQKATPAGDPRFVLLETIHEYARERLEASGELEALRRRHAEYFVALAERTEPDLRRSGFAEGCRRLELELENCRAVLAWSLSEGDVTLGVRLAAALAMFWYSRGYHVEGIRWTRRLLERLDETPPEYQARFLIGAGRVAFLVDLDAARSLFARAFGISRRLGDRLQEAWALVFLGFVSTADPGDAMQMATTSLAMFRDLDHLPGVAQALNIVGELARLSGDDARAQSAYEACLAVCQQTGEALRTCYGYANLAYIAQHEGDHERAMALIRRALPESYDLGGPRDIAVYLVTYAGSAAACNQPVLAARLLGAAEATLTRMGAFHQPGDRPEVDRIVAEVRAHLSQAAFDGAWREGQAMTQEQAVAYALAGG